MPKKHGYNPEEHWKRKADRFRMAVLSVLDANYADNPVTGSFQRIGEVHKAAGNKIGLTYDQYRKVDPALDPGGHELWARNGRFYVRVGIWRDLQEAFRYGMAYPGHRGLPSDELDGLDWAKYEAANPELWKPWTDEELGKVYGVGAKAIQKMRRYETLSSTGDPLSAVYPLPQVPRPLLPHDTPEDSGMRRWLHPKDYDLAPPPRRYRPNEKPRPKASVKQHREASGVFGGRGSEPYRED